MVRRRIRFRGLPRVTRFVLLAMLVLTAFYFFLQSSLFAVTEVRVEGNRLVASAEIVRLAALPAGTNLWRLDERQVLARLATHPLLEQVQLRRRLPGTVVLRVREREALAMLQGAGGFLVVDKYGAVMEKVPRLADRRLPLVSGLTLPGNIEPGARLSQPGLAGALQAAESLPPEMRDWVKEIRTNAAAELTAFTTGGVEVKLGPPERLAEKWRLLAELRASLTREGGWTAVRYMDLSYRGYPVIR